MGGVVEGVGVVPDGWVEGDDVGEGEGDGPQPLTAHTSATRATTEIQRLSRGRIMVMVIITEGTSMAQEMSVEARLHELGWTLPPAREPMGAYRPALIVGDLIVLSGHPSLGASECVGQVPDAINADRAKEAAAAVALDLVATLRTALGSLDRVVRLVQVTGYVNASPEFRGHSIVINGCSDRLKELFGEAGEHARSAVGVSSLPGGASVEISLEALVLRP